MRKINGTTRETEIEKALLTFSFLSFKYDERVSGNLTKKKCFKSSYKAVLIKVLYEFGCFFFSSFKTSKKVKFISKHARGRLIFGGGGYNRKFTVV